MIEKDFPTQHRAGDSRRLPGRAPIHAALPTLMLATLLTTPLLACVARADTDDGVRLVAGYSLRHENNLFRLPPGADPQTVVGKPTKSDDIQVATLGLRVDKSISLQRFELAADLVDYRYRTFDHLDFTARNYAAAWRWQLTPLFRGNLTSTRTQSLNNFSDFTNYGVRNIRTDENHRLDAIFELDGAWRALGGISRTVRSNSAAFLAESDTRIDAVDAGIRRDFASGASVGALARQGRGEYFNRPDLSATQQFDNGFTQHEGELNIVWPLSGKTTLQGRLGYLDRRHDHFPARDYSGPVGSASVFARISDKVVLTGGAAHELAAFQSDTASYSQTDRLNVGAVWQITGKTALRGNYDVGWRDYRGAIVASAAERSDTLRRARLALEWKVDRSVLLSADLDNERRASNQSAYDFRNTTGTVSAQFTF